MKIRAHPNSLTIYKETFYERVCLQIKRENRSSEPTLEHREISDILRRYLKGLSRRRVST
ncbi:MAG: hypothetical protein V3V96_17090 [Acidiferrobacterales bacterium]